jgi:hypothetical protein
MSVLSKRNLLVGIAILVIGVGACAAIWGARKFMRRSTSVESKVTAYLLDDRGEVNGLLLASGDQLHFSPQTGAVVASQLKVGDEVTASGHPGSQTSYGREVRVEQISANGRTIVEAEAGPPRPDGPRDKRGPRDREDRGDRPGPPDESRQRMGPPPPLVKPVADATPAEPGRASGNEPTARQTANTQQSAAPSPTPTPAVSPDIFKATGTISAHLVNGRGDVDGLILSSGEQMRFSPRVGKLVIAAEQGATTQVNVEGNGVRNERGTVIRPTQITVGNQTIALGR